MSAEDRKWLEEAMKAYSFNDSDRLTELVNQLKAWSGSSSQNPDESNEQVAM
jgi:hypothetical protein